MTLEDVGARVRQTITDHLLIGPRRAHLASQVADDTALVDGPLQLDSLDFVEITIDAEDFFDVELKDADVEACVTVGDFIALISRALGLVEVAA